MIKKNEPCFPDYNDCIVNLSCSILKHYGIKTMHGSLKSVDDILSKNPKHVVVILLDGMGMNILEQNLSYRDFLRRNLLSDYSSVFPPTTTASTTSFLSGKTPIEHGWLGWDVFFEQENKTVTCFHNTIQDSRQKAADYNVAEKYLHYESIIDQINESGKARANSIFPFGDEPHADLYDWAATIKKSIKTNERTFTYAYWENPDGLLHKLGNKNREVSESIEEINAVLDELCETAKDTVFFITADHGHISIENSFLQEDYPEIAEMLEREPSIEPRAISFYVKPEYKEIFAAKFNKFFENDYVLFSRKEAMNQCIFGDGFANENLTGIGDFVAASISHKTLLWNKTKRKFRSHHAGLTKEEMRIPLIWYETKNRKSPFMFIYYSIIAILIAFLAYIFIF